MRIDELHKFNDGTLNDVRTALDDILKRIGMKYLPQMYWKKFDESDTHVLERFDTLVGNPVKEILPKLNLPNHRSILTDSKEFIKIDMERRSVKVKELQERCIIKAFQDHQIKKGIKVSQGKDCVEIKQERYAMKILKEAGMEDFNQTLCPMEPGIKLSKTKDEPEVEAT
ncbi:hypothetical protein Tco_0190800 [Tanacetum coccineum]